MKILVLVKQTPDTETKIKLSADGKAIEYRRSSEIERKSRYG
ncbi:MAG: hypothetical protein NTV34_13845 [Proteobacteria bacterium]|nr:hypothetical protein [Pseudomonadota bacterium]